MNTSKSKLYRITFLADHMINGKRKIEKEISQYKLNEEISSSELYNFAKEHSYIYQKYRDRTGLIELLDWHYNIILQARKFVPGNLE